MEVTQRAVEEAEAIDALPEGPVKDAATRAALAEMGMTGWKLAARCAAERGATAAAAARVAQRHQGRAGQR